MDLDLEGRSAIITGGSRGIGRAIARSLLAEGVRVVVTSRDEKRAAAAARELTMEQSAKAEAIGMPVQLGDSQSVKEMVSLAADCFGAIGILVNSGADVSGYENEDFNHVTDHFLLEAIDVKVAGVLRCAQAVAPFMRAAGWGRIITIGGHTARHAGAIAAGARNAALVNLTAALAQALGPDGITATIVHPATTITESLMDRMEKVARRRGIDVETHLSDLAAANAIGRLVESEEVADVVTFLASPRSAAVTGAVIPVTGGAEKAVYY